MVLAFLYFYVYAFIGWVIELAYQVMYARRWSHGGFSWLPLCPIYGIGALLILLTAPALRAMPPWTQVLFLGVLLSAYEYIGGIFSEALLRKRLWDYSKESFWSFDGYTDIEHVFGWAVFGMFFLHVLHPAVANLLTLWVPR